ncbi:hypothetical protein AALO_G00310350 [Alosa alosa]|uniref:Clr5 domain-containing protein n=1 Tax=Alosa alosa TaxID=278164 RepID=A0AAV6FCR0_9TELE|nr:hypothetical protein AALO_G00310350 [Alosa alosa]
MRKERLRQAKISQKDWTKVARSWEYREIAELVNSADPCRALIDRLESKGFFVLKKPGCSTADVVTNKNEVVNNVPGSPGEQNHVLDRRRWIPADLLYPISVSKENHLMRQEYPRDPGVCNPPVSLVLPQKKVVPQISLSGQITAKTPWLSLTNCSHKSARMTQLIWRSF